MVSCLPFFSCAVFSSNGKASLAVPSRSVGVFFGIPRPVPLGIFYICVARYSSRFARVFWRLFPQSIITDGDADASFLPFLARFLSLLLCSSQGVDIVRAAVVVSNCK